MTKPQFHAQSLGFNNQMRNRRFLRGRVYILTNEMQTRDGLEDLVHLREDLYQEIVDTLFRRYVRRYLPSLISSVTYIFF